MLTHIKQIDVTSIYIKLVRIKTIDVRLNRHWVNRPFAKCILSSQYSIAPSVTLTLRTYTIGKQVSFIPIARRPNVGRATVFRANDAGPIIQLQPEPFKIIKQLCCTFKRFFFFSNNAVPRTESTNFFSEVS